MVLGSRDDSIVLFFPRVEPLDLSFYPPGTVLLVGSSGRILDHPREVTHGSGFLLDSEGWSVVETMVTYQPRPVQFEVTEPVVGCVVDNRSNTKPFTGAGTK